MIHLLTCLNQIIMISFNSIKHHIKYHIFDSGENDMLHVSLTLSSLSLTIHLLGIYVIGFCNFCCSFHFPHELGNCFQTNVALRCGEEMQQNHPY